MFKTIQDLKDYVKTNVSLKVRKRLRIHYLTDGKRTNSDKQMILHLPAFINIQIDRNFEIRETESCYTFMNHKVCVNVWKDEITNPHITVYSF
jgi:hypothetical protein